jgi:ATP-dependent exoDNAse (exonuclease V) alpha subunit
MTMTSGQSRAVNYILSGYNNGAVAMSLKGGPGTGKTYTVGEIARQFCQIGRTVAVAASTNKAVQVVKEAAKSGGWSHLIRWWGTAHRLLGLYLDGGKLRQGMGGVAAQYDVVIVDEASMLDTSMIRLLRKRCRFVLFVGDKNQLPPVGEDLSPAFITGGAELDEVVRQRGQEDLQALISYSRKAIEEDLSFIPSELLQPFVVKSLEVWQSGIGKSDDEIAIAFTNYEVDRLNRVIRAGAQQEYEIGDRLIFKAPLYEDKELIYHTNAIVGVDEASRSIIKGFPSWSLRVSNSERARNIVVPNYEFDNRNYVQYLISEGQKPPEYARVAFAYAVTAHRSQGSEYDVVHVQMDNFRRCQELFMRRKLAYVAFSRAKKTLRIYLGER